MVLSKLLSSSEGASSLGGLYTVYSLASKWFFSNKATCLTGAISIFVLWRTVKYLLREKNGKPMPHVPALPLFGSIFNIPKTSDARIFSELADKYGDVYDFYFFSE